MESIDKQISVSCYFSKVTVKIDQPQPTDQQILLVRHIADGCNSDFLNCHERCTLNDAYLKYCVDLPKK